eukprot:TRINITY_DN14344_c0_g1_i1.p1 TRINITY_DN14344_c0_g1~~TRINITY_DN14344_c0_g1_i1.p1  ORF type:complete len:662 (+),score=118.58 TRINITY_DN14344_c0_g1_i1:160-2145(+)
MSGSQDTAAEAFSRFLSRNYDQCLASLHSLLSSTPRGDLKVQHNVAVCEYFKGGCQDPGKFTNDLERLGKSLDREKKIEHLNSIAAVKKLATQRMQQYRPLCLEFEGHEYVRFNEAVVYFYQRQYNDALERLIPMFHNEKQITKLLHVRVILLLLSCTLGQYNRDDAVITSRVKTLIKRLNENRDFIIQHEKEEAASASPEKPLLRLRAHALLLAAHYEAVQGNAADALKLLAEYQSSTAGQNNWWASVVYLNNLSILHLGIGKPHLASLYLSKAIKTYESSRPKDRGMNAYPSIAAVYYNNGLSCMLRGKYQLGYKSFTAATPLLKDTPTLWLRLAQCCIRHDDEKLRAEQQNVQKEKLESLKQPTESPVPQRRVVCLPTSEMVNPPVAKSESGDDMSLIFADKCLRNAHYLLLRRHRGRKGGKPEEEQADNEEDDDESPEEGDGQLEESQLHAAAAEDSQLASVLQSVYSNMSYVALRLQNPAVALATCQKLLSLQGIYKEHKIVCLSYCVESLCKLNRSKEALELLSKQDLQELLTSAKPSCLSLQCGGIQEHAHTICTTDLPSFATKPIHMGSSKADRNKLQDSHAMALFTNLCVVHILNGNFSRAQQCLNQFQREGHQMAELLQLYLHLAMGNTNEAVETLKSNPSVPTCYIAATE